MIAARRLLVAITVMMFSVVSFAEELAGSLQWYQKVPLTTAVSGVVIAVHVDVGDSVKKDQPLLELDARLRSAQLKACEAGLKAAQNALEEAERELERTQEMYDQTLLADHDLQLAIIARDAADADMQNAEAKLVQATVALEYSTLRAPFAGRVVDRQVMLGQSINYELQRDPLLELADAAHMVARVQASAGQLAVLSLGKAVRVMVDGASLPGKVARVGSEPVPGWAGNYAVDVVFEPAGKLFLVGQEAKVTY